MRLICPHCYTNNTVPDETAGKEATCSYCGKAFPAPARYAAQVSDAASAVVAGAIEPARTSPHPEPPAQPPVPAPAPPAAPAADGGAKEIGISISPKAVAWVPAVAFALVFVLSFFPWVGSYAGGTAVYSQRPWGAMFGGAPKRNFKLEEAGAIPSGWIDRVRSDWKYLLPFFLLLLVGMAFAWAERGLRSFDPRKVPPLAKLWPMQNVIVFGCASLSFMLLAGLVINGFGMERAVRAQVTDQFEAKRAAAAESPAALAKVDHEIEQALAVYNLEHTTWLTLAAISLLLAMVAAGMRPILDARGNKPAPRLLLRY